MSEEKDSVRSHIKITRQAVPLVDRARKYKVLIDDRELGAIKSGETKSFPVDPGKHTIQLRIDWAKSPAMDY
jgi:hypothetical protein